MCKQKEEEDNKFDITYFLVQDVQKKKTTSLILPASWYKMSKQKKEEENKFDITYFPVKDVQKKKRKHV